MQQDEYSERHNTKCDEGDDGVVQHETLDDVAKRLKRCTECFVEQFEFHERERSARDTLCGMRASASPKLCGEKLFAKKALSLDVTMNQSLVLLRALQFASGC